MIEKVLLTSFVIFALWTMMLWGMIFQKVREWGERWPQFIQKPVYDCVVCMVPYYGSAFYWIYYGESWKEWAVVMLASMGLNAIISKLLPEEKED